MSKYIIILFTAINTPTDSQIIKQVLSGFTEILEWSLDFEDCDKVLRVVSANNIGLELVQSLQVSGVGASLLEIFNDQAMSIWSKI